MLYYRFWKKIRQSRAVDNVFSFLTKKMCPPAAVCVSSIVIQLLKCIIRIRYIMISKSFKLHFWFINLYYITMLWIQAFFQIQWKSNFLRFWLEKLNFGLLHSRKNTTKVTFLVSVENNYNSFNFTTFYFFPDFHQIQRTKKKLVCILPMKILLCI